MYDTNSSSTNDDQLGSSKENGFNLLLLIPIVLICLVLFLVVIFIRKCPRKRRRRIRRVEVIHRKSRQSRTSLFEPPSGRVIDQVGCLADMIVLDRSLRPTITDGSSTTYALSTNSATHNSSTDRNEIEDFPDLDLGNIPLRRLESVKKDCNITSHSSEFLGKSPYDSHENNS